MRAQKLFILAVLSGICMQAQWLNFPVPGVPRTHDGKVNLTAPAPRTRDGKPDLSGTWMHEKTTVAEVKRLFGNGMDAEIRLAPPGMEIGTQHKYGFNILVDFPAAQSPLRPQAAALMKERAAQRPKDACSGNPGFPLAGLLSEPIRIVQAPRMTVLLYEVDNLHRQIYTDGRPLLKEINLPAYLGYSVGRWEKDTFVVETVGFNDKTPLDLAGHPRSEAMHITERFRRRDLGHMDVEMTFDDPQMYTRPFTIKIPHELLPDADIFEMVCSDNEKDSVHLSKQ
jgi:hypothetical protein